MMISNKTLRAAAKVAAPFVALAALVAFFAFFAWRTWFRKEKYSEFQARQWNWTANKYQCARGWKDTGKDKPDDSKGSYLGTSWQGGRSSRHCKKNKYSAFSDVVWNDDKKEFRCPSGYTRNKREPQDSDRACSRKEDKKYEGGKNEKASTAEEGCTDPNFPAKGKRPDREGQCCRAKYSRVCAGGSAPSGGGGGSAPSGGGGSAPAPSGGKKADWDYCTAGDQCQSNNCSHNNVCVPASAPAPAPPCEQCPGGGNYRNGKCCSSNWTSNEGSDECYGKETDANKC